MIITEHTITVLIGLALALTCKHMIRDDYASAATGTTYGPGSCSHLQASQVSSNVVMNSDDAR